MKSSYVLLAAVNLLLLSLTAIMGFRVEGVAGFQQHYLLGVLSGLFTSFVHVLTFVYFIVQDKIVKQAILHNGLAVVFATRVEVMKSRALRLGMIGVGAIVATIALGAAIGIVTSSDVHLIAALAAIFINLVVFVFQYDILDRYSELFREAFHE